MNERGARGWETAAATTSDKYDTKNTIDNKSNMQQNYGGGGGGGDWSSVAALGGLSLEGGNDESPSSSRRDGSARRKSLMGLGKSASEATYGQTSPFGLAGVLLGTEGLDADSDRDTNSPPYSSGSRTPPGFEDRTLARPKSLGERTFETSTTEVRPLGDLDFSSFSTSTSLNNAAPQRRTDLGTMGMSSGPPPQQQRRRRNLKRCVTFAEGSVQRDRNYAGDGDERGGADHRALRERAGVNPLPPSPSWWGDTPASISAGDVKNLRSMKRVDSTGLVNQAFPSSIGGRTSPSGGPHSPSYASTSSTRSNDGLDGISIGRSSEFPSRQSSRDSHGSSSLSPKSLKSKASWKSYASEVWGGEEAESEEPANSPPATSQPSFPGFGNFDPSKMMGMPGMPPMPNMPGMPPMPNMPGMPPMPNMPGMPPMGMPPMMPNMANMGKDAQANLMQMQAMMQAQWMYWMQMQQAMMAQQQQQQQKKQPAKPSANAQPWMPSNSNRQQRNSRNHNKGGSRAYDELGYNVPSPSSDGRYGGRSEDSSGYARSGSHSPASRSPSSDTSSRIRALLAEHKATGRRPDMAELEGHVVDFARDAHGSRFVQFKMETATHEEKQRLVNEVCRDAVGLMQNVFGNYVIQNFFEHGTPSQRWMLAERMLGKMRSLCKQQHGCRVVQCALDLITPDQRVKLLGELLTDSSSIQDCAMDLHATHVLQKSVVLLQRDARRNAVQGVPPAQDSSMRLLSVVEDAVAARFMKLGMHPHACRLVQKVIGDAGSSCSATVQQIIGDVERNYRALALDQHGNFILQHILGSAADPVAQRVQDFVRENVVELSQHKFGSHLVEKSLSSATPPQAAALIKELLQPTGRNAECISKFNASAVAAGEIPSIIKSDEANGSSVNTSALLFLMKDPYANFVVQRAFDASHGKLRAQLATEIRQRSNLLSRFTYGRHILSHINDQEGSLH